MKLYKFEAGETDHICARNESEAIAYMTAIYDDAVDSEHYSITEIPRSQWASIMVRDDDLEVRVPATHYIGDPDNERDAFMVCSTCF